MEPLYFSKFYVYAKASYDIFLYKFVYCSYEMNNLKGSVSL